MTKSVTWLYTVTWFVSEREKYRMSWIIIPVTCSVQIFSHFLICEIDIIISTFQDCGRLNVI